MNQEDDDFGAIEDLDELEDLAGEELREALKDHAQTRGVFIAYRTCLEICIDKKAQTAARGQAASNVFRAAGLYAKREPSDSRARELHEMLPGELNELLAQAQRDLTARTARSKRSAKRPSGGGIFD